MQSPVGLAGRSVVGTFVATSGGAISTARAASPELALTQLPGLLVARYLGDSSEAALGAFTRLWAALRPSICGRAAVAPRIWRT